MLPPTSSRWRRFKLATVFILVGAFALPAAAFAAAGTRLEGVGSLIWPAGDDDATRTVEHVGWYRNDTGGPVRVAYTVAAPKFPDGSAVYGLGYGRETDLGGATFGLQLQRTDRVACVSLMSYPLLGQDVDSYTSNVWVAPGGGFEVATKLQITGSLAAPWPGLPAAPRVTVVESPLTGSDRAPMTTQLASAGPTVTEIPEPGTQLRVSIKRRGAGRYLYRVRTSPPRQQRVTLQFLDKDGALRKRVTRRLEASGRSQGAIRVQRTFRWVRAEAPRVAGRYAASWSCPVAVRP